MCTCMHGNKVIELHTHFRSVLFGQWGFAANDQQGITVLLHGPPGTGKTLAAEALGYEVGKPLKVRTELIMSSGGLGGPGPS